MAGPSIVIAGAGIIGCLTAMELAETDPAAEITVIDMDMIGSGTTRRSAGLHLPNGSTPLIRRMSAFSHAYYAGLARQHPGLPVYPVGATLITGADRGDLYDHGYLDVAAAHPEPGGVPDPAVRMPPGTRAWRIGGCHYADVPALALAIAARLRPRVRFAEGVAVTGLAPSRGRVRIGCGTGENITADRVVLAPGPWIAVPAWRELLEPLGLAVKKIVALHIERRPAPGSEAVIFAADDAFLLPLAHRGHWLFSYTCTEWDVAPEAVTSGLSAANIGAARHILRRYSPELAAACRSGRVCCDAYSAGHEPVVRALDDAGRIIFAGAASGSGYRLGPAIAFDAVARLRGDGPADHLAALRARSGPTAPRVSEGV
jgi:glycine/D-amino acid oxidase-like deaminating enzyme